MDSFVDAVENEEENSERESGDGAPELDLSALQQLLMPSAGDRRVPTSGPRSEAAGSMSSWQVLDTSLSSGGGTAAAEVGRSSGGRGVGSGGAASSFRRSEEEANVGAQET